MLQEYGNDKGTAKQGNAGAQPGACRELYTVSGDGIFTRRRLLFNDTGNAPAPKTPGVWGLAPKVLCCKSVCEKYHYLAVCHTPIPCRHRPFLSYFPYRKIYYFSDSVICGQDGLGLCKLA